MKKRRFIAMIMAIVMFVTMANFCPVDAYASEKNVQEIDAYEIEYILNSDWGDGFNAQINISANEQIDDWTLEFDYSREITDIWDAIVESHEENHYVIKCKEYNATIEAGQTITIGFNGNGGDISDEIMNVLIYSGDKGDNDTNQEPEKNPDINPGETEDNQKEVKITFNTTDYEEYEYEEESCYIVNDEITVITGTASNTELIKQLNYKIYDCLESVIKQGSVEVRENWIIEDAGLAIGYNRIEIEIITENDSKIEKISLINTCAENMSRVNVDMDDSDGDGIQNYYEEILGFDKNSADTDEDGLNDYDELLYTDTDPLKYDSDENGISDGDEDFDEDGLTNIGEIEYKTACYMKDTDGDGLTDYDEIKIYGTDPLVWDSDEDGIRDGLEIERNWNPLSTDSDEDGILDGEEVLTQTITEEINEDRQPGVKSVSVTFNCNGDIEEDVIIISTYNIDLQSSDVVGIVGTPVDIEVETEFDEATITIEYDDSVLGETSEEDLKMMWYDEANDLYVLLEDSYVDKDRNLVTYKTNHFSTYLLVDAQKWIGAMEENSQRYEEMSRMLEKYTNIGHMYKCIEESVTWNEANEKCKEMGGHLVSITSEEEQQIVEALMKEEGTKNNYWIGAERNSKRVFDKWVTGEEITYTHYKDGRPDNLYEEALSIYRNNNPGSPGECFGMWNDMFRNGERPGESFFGIENYGYICEWDYVGLIDSDGDGLYDIYNLFYSNDKEETIIQLKNGQIEYCDNTNPFTDSLPEDRRNIGDSVVVKMGYGEECWNCILFDAYSYYGLSPEFVYVDGRKNRNGEENNQRMAYITTPDEYVKRKYFDIEHYVVEDINIDCPIASLHNKLYPQWCEKNAVEKNRIISKGMIWLNLTPVYEIPYSRATECLSYYLNDKNNSTSKRKYIPVNDMMEKSTNMKALYEDNINKLKKASRAILNKENSEVYLAVSPSTQMWKGNDKAGYGLMDVISIAQSRTAFGVFNEAGAVLTAHCVYDEKTGQITADVYYYIVDYYDFSYPQIMIDLNAYGQACTYELYGIYAQQIVY